MGIEKDATISIKAERWKKKGRFWLLMSMYLSNGYSIRQNEVNANAYHQLSCAALGLYNVVMYAKFFMLNALRTPPASHSVDAALYRRKTRTIVNRYRV